jgi:hypothetical protein
MGNASRSQTRRLFIARPETSCGVLRVARVRVSQFSLYVDPGPALAAFSAKISPIRGHYA